MSVTSPALIQSPSYLVFRLSAAQVQSCCLFSVEFLICFSICNDFITVLNRIGLYFLQIPLPLKKEPLFPPLKKCVQYIAYSVLYVSVSPN